MDEKQPLRPSVPMSFPSNSNKMKQDQKEETKKVERIITGTVKKRKKPLGKKITETFLGDDISSIGSYIIQDILVPAAKAVVVDMVQGVTDVVRGSIEVALYGERRSTNRDRSRPYVSYNGYSSKDRRDERRDISQRSRSRHDFDEIVFETKAEALDVRDSLLDLISRYDQATVADLYDLAGITGSFTDNKYGWRDLRSSSTTRLRDGYVLNLPKPILLD